MKNEVKTWDDMRLKYPEERYEMSDERHKEFVEDCFKLYEQEGFNDVFSQITLDENELSVAEWFDRADIPDNATISLTGTMMKAFKDGLV